MATTIFIWTVIAMICCSSVLHRRAYAFSSSVSSITAFIPNTSRRVTTERFLLHHVTIHSSQDSFSISSTSTRASSTSDVIEGNKNKGNDSKLGKDENQEDYIPPWNNPNLVERAKSKRNAFRSRQHVNPLARRFQQQTILSDNWPHDMYDDLSNTKPFFVDIGCSRGGFLVDLCKARPDDYNYLGLEIRPIVAHQAQERVSKHDLNGKLGFVGCNANVDLHRLLSLLNEATTATPSTNDSTDKKMNLKMVSIQYPDPHFKSSHAKRRVVTTELVTTLAEFMPSGSTIFLQSDIQSVLDDMRLKFREQSKYFKDTCGDDLTKYLDENIIGVPTEREVSVLEKGLPVYRSVFHRTDERFQVTRKGDNEEING